jgi:protein-disulfide isomerase
VHPLGALLKQSFPPYRHCEARKPSRSNLEYTMNVNPVSLRKDRSEVRPWIAEQGLFWIASSLAIVIGALLILSANFFSGPDRYSTFLPRNKLTVPVSGTTMGLATAAVEVVVYSDFQCHYCQLFATTTERHFELAYIESGKARLTYKYQIAFGEESQLAAEASECAAEQNLFWPFHDALMELRLSPATGDLTIEKLQSIAAEAGLDLERFNDSLESHKYRDRVLRDDAEGTALGFPSIPALYVNGVKANDSALYSFERLRTVMDKTIKEVMR